MHYGIVQVVNKGHYVCVQIYSERIEIMTLMLRIEI